MTAREFVEAYRAAELILDELEKHREELEAMRDAITQSADGGVGGGTRSDRTGQMAAMIADVAKEIDAQELEVKRVRRRVVSVIDSLDCERQRMVLTRRYIHGETWDELAAALHTSRRKCFDLEADALEQIGRRYGFK